jgi:hypothetical protein
MRQKIEKTKKNLKPIREFTSRDVLALHLVAITMMFNLTPPPTA